MQVGRATDWASAIRRPEALLNIGYVTKRIGILVSEGFSLHDVSTLAEVFRLANDAYVVRHADEMPYVLAMLSERGGSVASGCSLRVWTDNLGGPSGHGFDTLFVVGGPAVSDMSYSDRLVKRLRAIAPKIRTIKALGDGRTIVGALNRSFERNAMGLTVEARRQRPRMVESEVNAPVGPGSGALVAALKVVKRDHGTVVAQLIAEHAMPGAWSHLGLMLDDGESKAVNSKISAAAQWLRENYHRPVSVTEAATVAQMSERNFLRRFKAQTGLAPSEFLLRARLDASCVLLTETDLPIDTIARRCGIWCGDGLAKIFRKRLSISPSEYRASHRHGAQAP